MLAKKILNNFQIRVLNITQNNKTESKPADFGLAKDAQRTLHDSDICNQNYN